MSYFKYEKKGTSSGKPRCGHSVSSAGDTSRVRSHRVKKEPGDASVSLDGDSFPTDWADPHNPMELQREATEGLYKVAVSRAVRSFFE